MDGCTSGTKWQTLALFLLEALGDRVADAGHPTWVTVSDDPAGTGDYGLMFSDDARGFLGWFAPPDCPAVGVVATAKVWVEEGPAPPPPGLVTGATTGVRVVCIVSRSGEIAWRLVPPDGPPLDTPPEEGRLLDCLRRCLGLPTPPPPAGPGRLQCILWLGAVLEEARRSKRNLSWRQVLDLHPVAGIICREHHRAPDAETLALLLDAADSVWNWEDLRLQADQGEGLSWVVPDGVAGWMDEGMFARWVLSELPAPDELIARIRPYVAASTARRLAHTVRSGA